MTGMSAGEARAHALAARWMLNAIGSFVVAPHIETRWLQGLVAVAGLVSMFIATRHERRADVEATR